LLFVPELREKYADAYRRYCSDAIDYVLVKTKFDNPYLGIYNPLEQYPETPLEGITAFTVHQLGKQYKALCTLSGEEGRSVKVEVEGAIFSNHLGAVALLIDNPKDGLFLLRRKNYTIWQNRTKNLFTLLSIPLEETFHFIMGQYTDRKIDEKLKRLDEPKVFEVQNLANHWMAVEEALVGGLVHKLLGDFIQRTSIELPDSEIERDIEEKAHLPRYKFRKTGIATVNKMGCREAINLFREDPELFSKLVT
jgi:hypothetical protein